MNLLYKKKKKDDFKSMPYLEIFGLFQGFLGFLSLFRPIYGLLVTNGGFLEKKLTIFNKTTFAFL